MTNWNITAGADAAFVGGQPSGADIDGGAIKHVGNVDATLATNVALGQNQPIITVTSGDGTSPSTPTGILGGTSTFNNNAQDVMKRVTDDLAGVSNTELRSGGSNSANRADLPHTLGVLQTRYVKRAIRDGNWNIVDGTWSSDPDLADSGIWSIEDNQDVAGTAKTSGVDHEAAAFRFTNRGPGEFTYHHGSGGQPTTDEYPWPYLW